MQEADVVTGGSLADASRREADALGGEPGDGGGEVVDPKAHVVQRGLVDAWPRGGVDGLHQIDLDGVRAVADLDDVLVDVLALAAKGAGLFEAEEVDPKAGMGTLVESTEGDLLHAEHAEGAFTHGAARYHQSRTGVHSGAPGALRLATYVRRVMKETHLVPTPRFAGLALALFALAALPGCTLVKGIFKAGMWVGVLAVVGLVVVVGGLMSLLRRK